MQAFQVYYLKGFLLFIFLQQSQQTFCDICFTLLRRTVDVFVKLTL